MSEAEKATNPWSAEVRFAAIVETATLSEAEVVEYCRKKGFYSEQLLQWEQGFLQISYPDNKAALRQCQKENKQLKKELFC